VKRLLLVAATGLALLALTGCAYDYLQRSDKIAYHSGEAVKANLARETINPASTKSTKGLGKDGAVVPAPPAAP
jgi:hypothetical protein